MLNSDILAGLINLDLLRIYRVVRWAFGKECAVRACVLIKHFGKLGISTILRVFRKGCAVFLFIRIIHTHTVCEVEDIPHTYTLSDQV
jgi:hypothetical protein